MTNNVVMIIGGISSQINVSGITTGIENIQSAGENLSKTFETSTKYPVDGNVKIKLHLCCGEIIPFRLKSVQDVSNCDFDVFSKKN